MWTVPQEWREHPVKCLVLDGKIYVTGVHLRMHVSPAINLDRWVFVSTSTDLNSWTPLPKLPVISGTLTTYRSKLVLVGGMNLSTYETTNKLWSLSEAGVWQESLPPMPTKRCKSGVVSTMIQSA